MARMTSRPRIGAILREGMVRKRLDQSQLAEAVGASRSAVNAWINDRQWPQDKYIGALEDTLDVKLPRWWAGEDESPLTKVDADPNEQVLQKSIDGLTPAEQEELRQAYRRIRDRRPAGNPSPRERAG